MDEEIKVIRGKLERAYESIQNLSMQPTKTNMEIALSTMAALKDAYDFLGTINRPEEGEQVEVQAEAITGDAPGEPEEEGGHV